MCAYRFSSYLHTLTQHFQFVMYDVILFAQKGPWIIWTSCIKHPVVEINCITPYRVSGACSRSKPCITWENHRRGTPLNLSHSLAQLYYKEKLVSPRSVLRRLFSICRFLEVIVFNCLLTPRRSLKMCCKVFQWLPHVNPLFFGFFSEHTTTSTWKIVGSNPTIIFCGSMAHSRRDKHVWDIAGVQA